MADSLYYYVCPCKDRYYTLFVGPMDFDIAETFKHQDWEKTPQLFLQVRLGSHKFCVMVDQPIYLIGYDKEYPEILEAAGDDRKLELFIGQDKPKHSIFPSIIEYPEYFTKDIEPWLIFRLGDEFCINNEGVWEDMDDEDEDDE